MTADTLLADNLQSHIANDQHGGVRYLLALLKFDDLCLM
jgi:hypothetical protein